MLNNAQRPLLTKKEMNAKSLKKLKFKTPTRLKQKPGKLKSRRLENNKRESMKITIENQAILRRL